VYTGVSSIVFIAYTAPNRIVLRCKAVSGCTSVPSLILVRTFAFKPKVEILVSAGASCPDAMVEAVLARIAGLFPGARNLRQVAERFAA